MKRVINLTVSSEQFLEICYAAANTGNDLTQFCISVLNENAYEENDCLTDKNQMSLFELGKEFYDEEN